MPKTSKQRRGEIVHDLRGRKLITPEDLRAAMEKAGVDCATARREYENTLEDREYIKRIPDGWELTEASKQDGIITIRVAPSQNKADVVNGLTAALQQFKPLATMEIEE